jgi:hypothetical protein
MVAHYARLGLPVTTKVIDFEYQNVYKDHSLKKFIFLTNEKYLFIIIILY